MKGLLLKDLYQTWKYYKLYFLIAIVFAVISVWGSSNPVFTAYPFFFMGMIPVGLLNLDESSKWEVYCGTLPCTKGEAVSGKYLMGLLVTLPVLALTLGAQLLRMKLMGAWSLGDLEGSLMVCVVMAFLIPAITLPTSFYFGSTKGRIIQLVAVAVFIGGMSVLGITREGKLPAVLNGRAVPWAVMLGVMGLYVLSWCLSVRFYEKREIQ